MPIGIMAWDTLIRGDQAPDYRFIGTILFLAAAWLAYKVHSEKKSQNNVQEVTEE